MVLTRYLPYHTSTVSRTLVLSLAVGTGLGFSSCTYFAWLVLNGSAGDFFSFADAMLFLGIILCVTVCNKKSSHSPSPSIPMPDQLNKQIHRFLAIVFCFLLVSAIAIFVAISILGPHGGWDACMIWNLRARFLFRGGVHWNNAFSGLLYWPYHTDYPLLIPANVARGWTYIGKETQAMPAMIGLLFTFATIGLLLSSLTILKCRSLGLLAAVIMLGTSRFLMHGTSQYADVPLGFYFLAAIALLFLQGVFPSNYIPILLAGMMSGFSCWTKNEGLLFFASFVAAYLIAIPGATARDKKLRQLAFFTFGSLPMLLILLYFKLSIVPPNDLFSALEVMKIVQNLTNPDRHYQILKQLMIVVQGSFPLVMLFPFLYYFGFDISRHRFELCVSALTICLVISGYIGVYLISPYNLQWHIATSLERLLIQLLPSIVFIQFIMLKPIERNITLKQGDTYASINSDSRI
ncbi:MAG: hypothetical protein HYS23_15925 [Geobacter sp.]|nr:hypothetical protein [Geobacter sp.]